MTSSLDQLKATGTTVVCDSGDFATIAKYKPQDATTNPSLILAAAAKSEYAKLVDQAVAHARALPGAVSTDNKVAAAMELLLVLFGEQILQIVPGRVSTEVDARLSFDTKGSVAMGLKLIELYKQRGIAKERVLIKIASTWEGIKAVQELQARHGVQCNLTLLFSLPQAIMAAEANAAVISPFVGRILDYYKAVNKRDYTPEEDPGVESVRAIYNYYKRHGHSTVVMGASFRNVGEVKELAGCDLLTVSPAILESLYGSTDPVPQKLFADKAAALEIPKRSYINDESSFRFDVSDDPMASEKLRDGISRFAADAQKLAAILRSKIESQQ